MASPYNTLKLTCHCARIVLWPAIFLNAGIIALCNTTASICQAVVAASSLCFAASYGFLINDSKDREVDRINGADRLENANESEMAFVRLSSGVLAGVSLILSASLGKQGFACIVLIILGLTIYTHYARSKLMLATVMAAILASSPLWSPSVIFNAPLSIGQAGVIFATVLLLMGREILFDATDVRGDSLGGRRTFANAFNQRAARDLSAALNVVGVMLLLLLQASSQYTPTRLISWAGLIVFSWLILPPVLRYRNSLETSCQVEVFTRRSRLAMLLLPVLWLSF